MIAICNTPPATRKRKKTLARVPRDGTDWLTPAEAATVIGVSPQTLAVWRHTGRGVAWSRPMPRVVRYSRAVLEDFLSSAEVRSTAEADARDRRPNAA